MLILAISSATPKAEVSLVDNEETIFLENWDSNYDEAEKILPQIETALKKSNKEGIDKIFVVQGPGAFTGLRIGITIANILAFVHKVPLVTCDTFKYFELKIHPDKLEQTAIMLRAGGQNVAFYSPQTQKITKMKISDIIDYISKAGNIKYILSDVKKEDRGKYEIPKEIKWMENDGLRGIDTVVKSIMKEKNTEHKIIEPKYLAAPSITKSKKKVFV